MHVSGKLVHEYREKPVRDDDPRCRDPSRVPFETRDRSYRSCLHATAPKPQEASVLPSFNSTTKLSSTIENTCPLVPVLPISFSLQASSPSTIFFSRFTSPGPPTRSHSTLLHYCLDHNANSMI